MDPNDHSKIIAQVIARAWMDEAFKRRFLANPVQVLKDAGLAVRSGVRIQVVEDSAQLKYIVLPVNPQLEGDDREGLQCSHIFCSMAEHEEG